MYKIASVQRLHDKGYALGSMVTLKGAIVSLKDVRELDGHSVSDGYEIAIEYLEVMLKKLEAKNG